MLESNLALNEKLNLIKPCLPEEENKLSPEICMKMLTVLNVPENIIRHVRAVRDKALEIAEKLNLKGLKLDLKLIENSALLHDICRTEKHHAAAGAELVKALGFKEEADIIRQHHDLESSDIDEAAVVYLADKLIKEDRPVSLDERFMLSADKCKSPEAMATHDRRLSQAKKVFQKVQNILNK